MKSLSVCLIVKNEENNIRECLKSIYKYADEIIVIDNGSSDNTVSILTEYNCKIIYSNEFYFDQARNKYLEIATGDWILAIDADERLTDEGMKKILDFINHAPDKVMGSYLPFYQYLGGGIWAYIEMMRLFRNHKSIKYNDKKIHPSPRPSIDSLGGIIQRNLYAPIHHLDSLFAKRTSRKREKYIDLSIKELKEIIDPGIEVLLANEYIAIQDFDNAEKLLLKVASSTAPIDIQSRAYLHLAQLYKMENKYEKSNMVLSNIVNKNNQFKSKVFNMMGMNFFELDNISKALQFLLKAIEYDSYAAHTYLNIALIQDQLADENAQKYYYNAIKLNPYLENPLIYQKGDTPNPYLHQNMVLANSLENIQRFKKNYINI